MTIFYLKFYCPICGKIDMKAHNISLRSMEHHNLLSPSILTEKHYLSRWKRSHSCLSVLPCSIFGSTVVFVVCGRSRKLQYDDIGKSDFICGAGLVILIIVYQSSLMKLLESSPKIAEIQSRLTKYTFLSRSNLPGYPDGVIFQALKKCQKYPDRSKYPNFYHWYILLRQFATSTITKWVEDRLYFDPNDALIQNFIKQQASLSTQAAQGSTLYSPSRQQNGSDIKNGKAEIGGEVEYEIDILLKQYTKQMVDALMRDLQPYKLEISISKETRQVKIKCGSQSNKRQQIANLISKTVEYQNLQVKKDKKCRVAFREEPGRE